MSEMITIEPSMGFKVVGVHTEIECYWSASILYVSIGSTVVSNAHNATASNKTNTSMGVIGGRLIGVQTF